jgi:hypothetical protein
MLEQGSRLGEVGGQPARLWSSLPKVTARPPSSVHHCGIHGRNGRPVFISSGRPLEAMTRIALPEPVLERPRVERAVFSISQ